MCFFCFFFVFFFVFYFMSDEGKCFAFTFYPIFMKLADNQDRHKISNDFEFRPVRLISFGTNLP